MAAGEIMGSRETTTTNKMTTAVKLLVSTSAGDGVAIGTFYASESGLTGRRCVHVKETPRFLADLILIVEQYQAPVAYA